MLAPIALFTYNRPWHTKKTLDALKKNKFSKDSTLYVFCDGPKPSASSEDLLKIYKVLDLLKTYKGFKEIIITQRSFNLGLAENIIDGISMVLDIQEKVIALEDDLVTSPYFLKFMNDGLNLYSEFKNVASIHGYVYPIKDLSEFFFIKGADCWGWATWKDRWKFFERDGNNLLERLSNKKLIKEFNFNNSYNYYGMLKNQILKKNSSWAIRWYASAFLNNMFTLYPGRSLVQHIGNDRSGTHCGTEDFLKTEVSSNPIDISFIEVKENPNDRKKFELFFFSIKNTFFKRVKLRIVQILKYIKNQNR